MEDKGYDPNDIRFDWSKDIKYKETYHTNNINTIKNNMEDLQNDEKEKDMQNNNEILGNKHLITNNNLDEINNANKKKNNGERVNTQFANYNTTVQVTDNPPYNSGQKEDNNNNNDMKVQGVIDPQQQINKYGQTGNDNINGKKKKNKKEKCIIF